MAAALAFLLPFAFLPHLVASVWAGFGLGLVREITEEGEISIAALKHCFTGPNSRRDIMFWTLGGALAGIL
jgi:hypothetical protein